MKRDVMVSIDFQIDPEVLAKYRTLKPTKEDMGVISHIWLRMPIRLVVGGVTILDWAGLPLFHMAYDALYILNALPEHGRDMITLPGDGSLLLEMEGNEVAITVPDRVRTGRADYSEVLTAWEDFSRRVRSFLLREFPDFRDHPQLGSWFRESPE